MSRKSGKSTSAAGEASSYPVLRVLREASSSPPPPGTKVYHPPAAMNLAAAHGWMTYKTFMSILRKLMEVSFRSDPLRHDSFRHDPYTEVDDMLKRLATHSVPFAADHRFPDDEVYVCVDRAPVGSLLVRMRGAMAMGLAGVCEFFDAVRLTMNVVTGEDGNGLPVLYDRSIFESVFQLQWTCNERQASTASAVSACND